MFQTNAKAGDDSIGEVMDKCSVHGKNESGDSWVSISVEKGQGVIWANTNI